jgi:hypothetical protein
VLNPVAGLPPSGECPADLGGSRDGRNRRICRDDVDDGTRGRTGRGGTRPAGIRGDDGNRQRVADIRRDGNIGGDSCPSDRRPRAFTLIGEGGWIVGPGTGCRRQRLAHLRGSRDRWDRAVRRNHIDGGAGRRARRGRAGAETVRGRDRDGEDIPNIRGHRDVSGSCRTRDRTPARFHW